MYVTSEMTVRSVSGIFRIKYYLARNLGFKIQDSKIQDSKRKV